MKFNTKLQRNLIKMALFSLSLFASNSYSAQSEDATIATAECKAIGAFYMAEDQLLTQFFSSDNQTPYSDFLTAMIRKETEYLNKLMIVQPKGPLSKKTHEVAQEAHKHFSAVIGVIKQYNKPNDNSNNKNKQNNNNKDVAQFINDMNRVFDPEIAFTAISTKLQVILKEAEAAQETELVAVIQQLINILKKKHIEWVNKGKLTLLAGLTKRMSNK